MAALCSDTMIKAILKHLFFLIICWS